MARRLGVSHRVAIVLASVTTFPLAAQDYAAQRAEIDSLARVWQMADSVARAVEAAAQAAIRVDTIAVGGFLIISDSVDHPDLRAAADVAWRGVTDALGTEDAHLADGGRAYVRFGPARESWSHLVSETEQTSPSTSFFQVAGRATRARLTAQLRHAMSQTIMAKGGGRLRVWTTGRLGVTEGDRLYEWAFIELVTAPSQAARFCYLGDLSWCSRAMGIVPMDDTLMTWYSPDDLRAVARRNYGRDVPRTLAASYDACVAREDDAACVEYVRRRTARSPPPPVSGRSNGALAWTAKKVGGQGAFTRMFADTTAPFAERMTTAAGMPLDSLVAHWRDSVLARRPEPFSERLPGDWVVLGWAVVFGVLALRSSRWR